MKEHPQSDPPRDSIPIPRSCASEDDYYIATSTFEWYPGVQIHHSRDLVHWRLLTRPLRRASQLNMLGVPDSCGVWAPCLTYADGRFWLIYTDVKRYGTTTLGANTGAVLRDMHNYLVTSRRSTANGPIPVSSTAAASTRRCSTTRTDGSTWSTCAGTTGRA